METLLLLTLPPDRIGHGTFLLPSSGGTEKLSEIVSNCKIPLGLLLYGYLCGMWYSCFFDL